ncbi:MAG TPA: isoprenylcysteine carboxylmethyltransferase family protein [Gammaproteobacteria bacterium]|nr:isoprenylcysteine carboxylmethyltransferase family protein [Gammaproteobacteria bacterium]
MSLILGFGLEFWWPLTFTHVIDRELLHVLGAPLLLLGSALIYMAKREMARHGQPSEPHQATARIVTSGPFKYSRNPLYTGLLLAYLGLSVGTDMPWWTLLFIPTMFATRAVLIAPEERYLEHKFGQDYLAYKRAVRRWL